jgi:hypothetical protein
MSFMASAGKRLHDTLELGTVDILPKNDGT